jgi:cobalt/nickel transport system permease protein
MHISDGIISTPVCIAAHLASAGLLYLSGKGTGADEIPKMGMTGAALFTASLIQFPVAGTSVHPGLFGLTGILLGKRSFPVIYMALLFQSLFFQHGGLLSLGLNALNMGAGAYAAWMLWRITVLPEYLRSALAGFIGIITPALLMTAEFRISSYGSAVALLLAIYAVSGAIEGAITLSAVKFFRKVKPEILTN